MIARLACAAALVAAAAHPALAQEDAGAPEAAEIQLRIEVGKTVPLASGRARLVPPLLCDDGAIVERLVEAAGLALRGLKAGETSCSVLTAAYTTLRYRVRVVEPPPAPSK